MGTCFRKMQVNQNNQRVIRVFAVEFRVKIIMSIKYFQYVILKD